MCWPAVDRIAADTCLNKETVIAAVERLIEMGLLERKKRWGQSPIYRLIGVADRHSIPENQNSGNAELRESGIVECSNPEIQNSGKAENKEASVFRKSGTTVFRKPGKESTNESTKEIINTLFDEFWSFWPKRDAKADAIKAFGKLKPTQDLVNKIRINVEARLRSGDWSDRKYIPLPASYLNGRRWEDELPPNNAGPPPSSGSNGKRKPLIA